MKLILMFSLLLTVFLSSFSANAFDINELSVNERDMLRTEIRSYLLENPEVLTEAIAVLKDREKNSANMSEAQLVQSHYDAIVNDATSWEGGNPEGDIILVEFIDYRCGNCRTAHSEVKELVRSDGNIRYIIKEYPILGPKSELASRFSIATRLVAGDDAYETMYNGLFVYKGAITSASLMGLANNLGLDGAAISALLNDPKIDQIMGRSVGLGQKLGINGTPTFIMNGQMLRGYVPLEKMRALAKSLRKG